jgi:hypothetical protein
MPACAEGRVQGGPVYQVGKESATIRIGTWTSSVRAKDA